MRQLSNLLEESTQKHPAKVAMIAGDQQISHQQQNDAANQIAHGLVKAGVTPRDQVALYCPNLPFFPIVYYGLSDKRGTCKRIDQWGVARRYAYDTDVSHRSRMIGTWVVAYPERNGLCPGDHSRRRGSNHAGGSKLRGVKRCGGRSMLTNVN